VIERALRLFTPEEYLKIERESEFKSEYYCGRIYAMAAASRAHSLIAGNIFAKLHSQMETGPCEAHTHDMRVLVPRPASIPIPMSSSSTASRGSWTMRPMSCSIRR